MIDQTRYTDEELRTIIDQGTIYMCACPCQVAVQLRHLRELYRYQTKCQLDPGNDLAVHQTIAAATLEAHALMEGCLEKVLAMEGWDPVTLAMPEGLRRKRDDLLKLEE